MPAERISSESPPTRSRRAVIRNGALALGGLAFAKLQAIAEAQQATGLAAAWKNAFRIGVAVSNQALEGKADAQLDLIAREFNSVTAENAMKWGVIRPDGVHWQWERADRLVEFANRHEMDVVGHTLVWHSQVPNGIFVDADRKPVSRDALLATMQEHIEGLVGRYKGRVWAWDVVNEAIDEGKGWRRSPWFNIIGEDFMERAFRFAHAVDRKAKLLYNDYNMDNSRQARLPRQGAAGLPGSRSSDRRRGHAEPRGSHVSGPGRVGAHHRDVCRHGVESARHRTRRGRAADARGYRGRRRQPGGLLARERSLARRACRTRSSRSSPTATSSCSASCCATASTSSA